MERAPKIKLVAVMKNEPPSNRKPSSRSGCPRPPSPSKSGLQATPSPLGVIRPKSKVNTSATTRKTSAGVSGTSVSTSRNNVSTTPRARSPSKPSLKPRSRPPSPTLKSPTTPLVSPAQAASSSFESRQLSLSPVSPQESLGTREKTRHGSVSLHHALSFTSLHTRTSSVSSGVSSSNYSTLPRDDPRLSQVAVMQGRVKAKVSAMAKQAEMANSLPPSPTRSSHRLRAPSVSSSVSLNSALSSPPNLTFYPITTATPAANPHRYATTRPSPPTSARIHYQMFPSNDGTGSLSNLDSPYVTTPLHSPPHSALSFSSRSSASKRSSVSYLTEPSEDILSSAPTRALSARQLTPLGNYDAAPGLDSPATSEIRPTFENLSFEQEVESEDRKVKAEAKSNRKIADLEITNRSLLAINASLESAKHRQAKEIRELRRKLRESRLILPPPAYRAVKPSEDHDDSAEEDEDEGAEGGKDDLRDELYERIKVMLEGLLETGRRALESRPKDFPEGGTKVLSAEEVRSWRDFGDDATDLGVDQSHEDIDLGIDGGNGLEGSAPPSHITLLDSSNDFLSEEEVEAMTLTQVTT